MLRSPGWGFPFFDELDWVGEGGFVVRRWVGEDVGEAEGRWEERVLLGRERRVRRGTLVCDL